MVWVKPHAYAHHFEFLATAKEYCANELGKLSSIFISTHHLNEHIVRCERKWAEIRQKMTVTQAIQYIPMIVLLRRYISRLLRLVYRKDIKSLLCHALSEFKCIILLCVYRDNLHGAETVFAFFMPNIKLN